VKDLRILNRSLSEVVLVDNAAYSYSFQLENGIPILPFYEGKDSELAALEGYLA
jgi:CTD small phosphatase-like protein 2